MNLRKTTSKIWSILFVRDKLGSLFYSHRLPHLTIEYLSATTCKYFIIIFNTVPKLVLGLFILLTKFEIEEYIYIWCMDARPPHFLLWTDPKFNFLNGYSSVIFKARIYEKISKHWKRLVQFESSKKFKKIFWEIFVKLFENWRFLNIKK